MKCWATHTLVDSYESGRCTNIDGAWSGRESIYLKRVILIFTIKLFIENVLYKYILTIAHDTLQHTRKHPKDARFSAVRPPLLWNASHVFLVDGPTFTHALVLLHMHQAHTLDELFASKNYAKHSTTLWAPSESRFSDSESGTKVLARICVFLLPTPLPNMSLWARTWQQFSPHPRPPHNL